MEIEAKVLYAKLTKLLADLNAAMTPGAATLAEFNAIQDEIESVGAELEIVSDALFEARRAA